jgi:hypothetical protein
MQIAALRFASNEEIPISATKAIVENLPIKQK